MGNSDSVSCELQSTTWERAHAQEDHYLKGMERSQKIFRKSVNEIVATQYIYW